MEEEQPKKGRRKLFARLKQGFSHIGTLNIVLIVVAIFFFWFNWQMLEMFRLYATIPETYACAVITATLGECGICGWIRTTKDRKREHDWEDEDKKRQAQPPPQEQQEPEYQQTNAIGFTISTGDEDDPGDGETPCG